MLPSAAAGVQNALVVSPVPCGYFSFLNFNLVNFKMEIKAK